MKWRLYKEVSWEQKIQLNFNIYTFNIYGFNSSQWPSGWLTHNFAVTVQIARLAETNSLSGILMWVGWHWCSVWRLLSGECGTWGFMAPWGQAWGMTCIGWFSEQEATDSPSAKEPTLCQALWFGGFTWTLLYLHVFYGWKAVFDV